jgi:type II secretory pathway component GspD/PulD (secretin)
MRMRFLLPSSLLLALFGCKSTEHGSPPPPEMESPALSEGAAQGAALESPLDQAAEHAQVVRGSQQYLSDQYVAQADKLLEQADLEGALAAYSDAIDLLPSNEKARAGLRKVRALMGDTYQQADQYFEDAYQREVVRRTQARLEVEQLTQDGDNYLRAQDYDKAIESYRRAETILRFNPLLASQTLDEKILSQKLASAVALAEEERVQNESVQAEEARKAREAREEESRDYRENKLRTLYSEANNAFHREQYGLAESLTSQILIYDPGNEFATNLLEIARAARHQKAAETTDRDYRENWIRTFDELSQMGVPQADTIEFDFARWREVRDRQPYAFTKEDVSSVADKQEILQRLSETRVPARFGANDQGAPLEEVATYLQNVSGVNFVISAKVRDEVDDEEKSILLNLPERSILSLLNIITEVRANLRWKVENGVVKFVTAEELTGGQILKMYEVRDLIRPISDFPGHEINVNPSNGVPESTEDLEKREALVITEDALDNLIRDNIAPASWDADPANSLRISNGTMVVNQTPEVQDQIERLLEDLREATGILVDIQARFLRVEDNFLEDIGVDFRGLGAPGKGTNAFFNDFGNPTAQQTLGGEIGTGDSLGAFLDEGGDGDVRARTENLFDSFLGDEDVLTGSGGLQFQWTYLNDLQLEMVLTAVSKSERVELVTAPRVLVFNTARSNLSVMNQLTYVQDFDVEIAQGASIANPVISVVQDGVVLDVRPVVSADRRFITLELRPTVAELKRPIRTFTTSLGVSGNSVTIQLPELEISRVRTSIPMPDGGTVLLGGMKIHDSQDLRSGTPILNKIPLISFLFERQGSFVTNRKLLILLKAKIVIPAEHEPTPAQLGLDETLQIEKR